MVLQPSPDPAKPPAKLLKRLLGLARRPPVEGFVDRVVAGEVHGWAWDPARPERRLLVVATLDGEIQGEALADLPRRDLEAAGKGDGKHGFRLRLPPQASAQAGRLLIQVMIGSQRFPLRRGAVSVTSPATTTPEPKPEVNGAVVGYVETCRGHAVKGWAVNPNNPGAPALVDVFDDELYLGSVLADIEMPRLREGGAPHGARGFAFKAAAGKTVSDPERLRVRISGTRHELRRGANYPGVDGPAASVSSPIIDEAGTVDLSAPPAIVRAASVSPRVTALIAAVGSSDHEPESSTAVRLVDATAPDADQRLRRGAEEAEWVVFLPAQTGPAPELTDVLDALQPATDVAIHAPRGDGTAARVSVLLGVVKPSGLAIRAAALAGRSGPLLEAGAPAPDLIRDLCLDAGFRWTAIPTSLSTSHEPAQEGAPMRPSTPSGLVSFAVLGQWREGPPAPLLLLMDQSGDRDVEVLCPPSPLAADWQDALQRERAGAVRLKPVDLDGAEIGQWREFIAAASGDFVVLLDADLSSVSDGALDDLLAWASCPHVGAVSPTLNDGARTYGGLLLNRDGPAGATLGPAPERGAGSVAVAIPNGLTVLSRAALVRGGLVDSPAAHGATSALGLGLLLKRRGLAAVVLSRHSAQLPGAALDRLGAVQASMGEQVRFAADLAEARGGA